MVEAIQVPADGLVWSHRLRRRSAQTEGIDIRPGCVQFPVLFEEGWTDKALYLERVRSLWGQLMGNNSTGSINIGSNIHGSSTGAGGGGGGGSNETSLYCHERGSVKEARRFSRGSGGQHRQWSATQSGAMVQPAWVTLKATAFQHVLLCTLNSIN